MSTAIEYKNYQYYQFFTELSVCYQFEKHYRYTRIITIISFYENPLVEMKQEIIIDIIEEEEEE